MNENLLWKADLGDGRYQNPVLYADYSDPDAIRVGSDYYMVSSSFSNAPAIPVLHSKDLVNWEIINHCLRKLPFDSYDIPSHGKGVWAPSIRYHNNLFYVFFSMPDEGIFITTAKDPRGKWTEPVCIKKIVGWIDPCPFWDDDGRAYLVNAFSNGRIGIHSVLQITEMSYDGMSLTGESHIVFDGRMCHPVIEGPKLYKINNYYYIFAPAGTVKTGWQTVLRAKNILGPYEDRISLIQGGTSVNGPHQGALVDTPGGEYWFLHFQHLNNVGRVVHLQPVIWENDDWPTIGRRKWPGLGVPYKIHKKPDIKSNQTYAPADSDDFDKPCLGLQWQWNANPSQDWYEIDELLHQLRLVSQKAQANLYMQPNILLQKMNSPHYTVTSSIICDEMMDGDLGGILCFGKSYAGIFIETKEAQKRIVIISGTDEKNDKTDIISTLPDCKRVLLYMNVDGIKGSLTFSYCIVGNNVLGSTRYTILRWVYG